MNKFEDHNTPIETLSPAMMQAYVAGELSPRMQHAVEKFLLDHPFEAEAMEGYAPNPEQLNELAVLNERLASRINQADQRKVIPLWRQFIPYAASFILLLVATITAVYFFGNMGSDRPISLQQKDLIQLDSLNTVQPKLPISTAAEDFAPSIAESTTDSPMQEVELALQFAKKEPKKAATQPPSSEAIDNMFLEVPEGTIAQVSQEEKEVDMPINKSIDDTLEENIEELVLKSKDGVKVKSAKQAKKEMQSRIAEKNIEQADYQGGVSIATQKLSNKLEGRVIDAATGEALPGVNIMIKNANYGVTTDLEGRFSIEVKKDDILQILYIGMKSKEVAITDFSEMEITLNTDVQQLSEVVVTSYGEETSEDSYISAKPVNGKRTYQDYLRSQIQYPPSAVEKRIEGTVKLKVTITAHGDIGVIEVVKSLSTACDAEAIRLVKEGPLWKAAEKNGQAVEGTVKVKIKFELGR